MKESQIQSKIIERHQKLGWFVTKLIQTTTNGIPDLMLIKHGRVVFIEVKAKGKKPEELQLYRHAEMRGYGVEVYWTDDLNFQVPLPTLTFIIESVQSNGLGWGDSV